MLHLRGRARFQPHTRQAKRIVAVFKKALVLTTVRNWVRDGLQAAILGDVDRLRTLLELRAERYHRVAALYAERVPSRGGDGWVCLSGDFVV